MTEQDQKIFNQLPKPSSGLPFSLLTMEVVCVPHNYAMESDHYNYCNDSSDDDSEIIARAEADGVKCATYARDVYFGSQVRALPYNKHLIVKTLFIAVEGPASLCQVKGLQEYLARIGPMAKGLGIHCFAFLRMPVGWGK